MRSTNVDRWAALLALALVLQASGSVEACQFDDLGFQPSWQDRINDADEVFIGEVVAIRTTRQADREKQVLFRVDVPIKGDVGAEFESLQGSGGDCGIHFSVGDVVIFAGDSIKSPTVFLAAPPTREQKMQLGYLKQILKRAEADRRSVQ